jgi:hypothetical protein
MERLVIQMPLFSKELDQLISDNKLLVEDYQDFEWRLVKNPLEGDVITGLSGIRKTRLKAANKGKRGGFRVDYLDIPEKKKLYLFVIYSKNIKEDLSSAEKKELSKLVEYLKKEARHG